MRTRLGIVYCSCALLVSSSCLGATLEPVQGNLYINDGRGFQPVNDRVDANVGQSVMVAPGGTAMVIYPDGCKVAVQPGQVTTITSASPCTNPFPADQTLAQDAPSNGGNAGLAWGVAGTALGAAGLGVGLYALSKHNSNTTVN